MSRARQLTLQVYPLLTGTLGFSTSEGEIVHKVTITKYEWAEQFERVVDRSGREISSATIRRKPGSLW